MIVTIDGPAGSGKSTIANLLAKKLHIPFLDTGAMYRSVAVYVAKNALADKPNLVIDHLALINISFDWTRDPPTVLLNQADVSAEIRSPEITALTSRVACLDEVRAYLVSQQQAIGRHFGSLVTEGRDQGSVVFPNAEYKFYLDAQVNERAARRVAQFARRGVSASLDQVREDILRRDAADFARRVGPLARPVDALVVDTTHMTIAEVVAHLAAHIERNAV
ncbi:MAG: (d)CMP kinase [Phycisphaerae bacterium]